MNAMTDTVLGIFGMKRIGPGCRSCAHARIFETGKSKSVACFCLSDGRTRLSLLNASECRRYVLETGETEKRRRKTQEGRQP